MPIKDDSWRWRDVFPSTYAAWLMLRGGSQRSAKYVSDAVVLPSAWTTAVLAGGLALFLTVVLLLVDPPPEAALPSGQSLALLSGSTGLNAPPLELEFVHGAFPVEWDERPEEFWVSQPPIDDFNPGFPLVLDNWAATRAQPLTADAPATQNFDPYYLRTEFIDFDQLTAAVAADDAPAPGAPPVVLRDVAVLIERGPAAPAADGAVAYSLHVFNPGAEPAGHVRVIETLPEVERVIDVTPPAVMTLDGALVWELADLAPYEERVLTITLMPGEWTSLDTIAAVDVETQFSVATLVHPAETVEPFTAAPDPVDLALPAIEEPIPEPAPVSIDEPFVDVPVEESPVAMPAEQPKLDEHDPFGPVPAVADEPPVMPSWLLDDDDGPPAIADERPVPAFPAFDEPVLDEPPPEPDWNPTPRPIPLDPAQPPRPLLSLKARSQPTAAAGDVVTTVFEIVNDGDAPAEGVLLTVHLDAGLRHKHGETVEHQIERLAPGESRTATLYTRAATEGIAKFDAVLSHAGHDEDSQEYSVRITLSKTGNARTPPRR